jgi:hypothetical protein
MHFSYDSFLNGIVQNYSPRTYIAPVNVSNLEMF